MRKLGAVQDTHESKIVLRCAVGVTEEFKGEVGVKEFGDKSISTHRCSHYNPEGWWFHLSSNIIFTKWMNIMI